MPIFTQLCIDFPTFNKKINKKVTSSGGATKIKNSTTECFNQVQTSTNLRNVKENSTNKTSSSKKKKRLTHQ